MPSIASFVAKCNAAITEFLAIPIGPPPPPPPPTGSLLWFLSKAPGSITNIGMATMMSINQGQTSPSSVGGFAYILAASGGIYVPWLGRYGMIVLWGGGHTDSFSNAVIAFDLYTQIFVLLKPQQQSLHIGPNGYHADSVTGELWADAAGTATLPDQPSSGHGYGLSVALPPGFGTSDPKGAMLSTCRASLTPGGQRNGLYAHEFGFSTNQYSRFAGPLPGGPEYGFAFLDVGRRRVMIHSVGGLTALNVDTRAYNKIVNLPSGVPHMVWGHDVADDLYVGLSVIPGPFVWIVDPKTNVHTVPGIGTWPWPAVRKYGGGFWSDALGGIVYYHGQGESDIRLVKPSGNPRTTPWTVSTIAFAGSAPPPDTLVGAGAHCKRFLDMPAANGFLWFGAANAPVQFFKRP